MYLSWNLLLPCDYCRAKYYKYGALRGADAPVIMTRMNICLEHSRWHPPCFTCSVAHQMLTCLENKLNHSITVSFHCHLLKMATPARPGGQYSERCCWASPVRRVGARSRHIHVDELLGNHRHLTHLLAETGSRQDVLGKFGVQSALELGSGTDQRRSTPEVSHGAATTLLIVMSWWTNARARETFPVLRPLDIFTSYSLSIPEAQIDGASLSCDGRSCGGALSWRGK